MTFEFIVVMMTVRKLIYWDKEVMNMKKVAQLGFIFGIIGAVAGAAGIVLGAIGMVKNRR